MDTNRKWNWEAGRSYGTKIHLVFIKSWILQWKLAESLWILRLTETLLKKLYKSETLPKIFSTFPGSLCFDITRVKLNLLPLLNMCHPLLNPLCPAKCRATHSSHIHKATADSTTSECMTVTGSNHVVHCWPLKTMAYCHIVTRDFSLGITIPLH